VLKFKRKFRRLKVIRNQLKSSTENENVQETKRKPERFINVKGTTTIWDVLFITNRKILAYRPDMLYHDKKELHTDRCSHTR